MGHDMTTTPRFVFLTGAGISAESGIPTFRTPDGGGPAMWAEHSVDDVATPAGYRRNRNLVHRFYQERREACAAAEPNAAHYALAALAAALGDKVLVVTQNVDDLHERAGLPARNLIHMHGALATAICAGCRHRVDAGVYGDRCPRCRDGLLRPDVVWFGERPYEMPRIERAVRDAYLFVAVGTSGEVYPAAGLVDIARVHGASTVELNLQQTSGLFDETRLGPASRTVPELVKNLIG